MKNNENSDWLEGIMNMPHHPQFFGHTNASCLNCDVVEKHMVRIGAIIMCPRCCKDIFLTDDPVTKEREEYLKWLKIYKEKSQEE